MFSRAACARIGPAVPGVQASGIATSSAVTRRRHPDRAAFPRPAPAERAPALQARVGKAPRGELVLRPLVRFLHLRGARQPRTDPVHELGGRLHDLRVREPFEPDFRHHVEVHRAPARKRRNGERQRCRGRSHDASNGTSLDKTAARYHRAGGGSNRGRPLGPAQRRAMAQPNAFVLAGRTGRPSRRASIADCRSGAEIFDAIRPR